MKLDTIVQDDWVEHGSHFSPSSSASTLNCFFCQLVRQACWDSVKAGTEILVEETLGLQGEA